MGAGPAGGTALALAAAAGLSEKQALAALGQLADAAMVERRGDGRWAISPGILAYARPVLSDDALLSSLRPLMRELSATYEETVTFFRSAGWNQIVLEVLESPRPVRYVLDPGTRFPLYVGAGGKAHLAMLPQDRVDDYLANLSPRIFTRFEVDIGALRRELVAIRALGYATSFGERVEGAAAVAVPVMGPEGEVGGVLGVMMPIFRTSTGALAEIGEALVACTRRWQPGDTAPLLKGETG